MDSHVILSSVFLVLHQDMELQSNNHLIVTRTAS